MEGRSGQQREHGNRQPNRGRADEEAERKAGNSNERKKAYTGFQSCLNTVQSEYRLRERRIILKERSNERGVILDPKEYIRQIGLVRAKLRGADNCGTGQNRTTSTSKM